MSQPKYRYSRELKLEAVRRVLESCLPQNQVVRELGLSPNTLSSWKRQFQAEHQEALPSIEQSLTQRPFHAGTLYEAALIERDNGREDAALVYLERALEVW